MKKAYKIIDFLTYGSGCLSIICMIIFLNVPNYLTFDLESLFFLLWLNGFIVRVILFFVNRHRSRVPSTSSEGSKLE